MLDELARLMPVIQTLIVPAMGYVGFVMRGVRNEFRVLNGRLGKLEQWKETHSEAVARELDQIHDHLEERRH